MTEQLEKLGRKITLALLVSQSLFSASRIMTFTVASIIALQLANDNSQWSGVPSTLGQIGVALTAYPMGRLMDRAGRRRGLTVGYLVGIGGAIIAGVAVIQQSLVGFLIGVFFMGMTKSGMDLSRYAAAEANLPLKRARAISWVILGGTTGSILGPTLIRLATEGATRLNLAELSGPWFASALLMLLSVTVLNLFLRPDPQEIARQIEDMLETEASQPGRSDHRPAIQESARSVAEIFSRPAMQLALAAMIVGQVVMVMIMTITPVHMHQHQQHLSAISLVIMAHSFGMFGLSFMTGWLIDKFGRVNMIVGGGLILVMAGLISPASTEPVWLATGLFLLGLGWNFCYVTGSALLADNLQQAEKGRIQGLSDTAISATSALASLSSGLVFASVGFITMNLLSLAVAIIPIGLVLYYRAGRPARPIEEAV